MCSRAYDQPDAVGSAKSSISRRQSEFQLLDFVIATRVHRQFSHVRLSLLMDFDSQSELFFLHRDFSSARAKASVQLLSVLVVFVFLSLCVVRSGSC
jgi:hypothetical protein